MMEADILLHSLESAQVPEATCSFLFYGLQNSCLNTPDQQEHSPSSLLNDVW